MEVRKSPSNFLLYSTAQLVDRSTFASIARGFKSDTEQSDAIVLGYILKSSLLYCSPYAFWARLKSYGRKAIEKKSCCIHVRTNFLIVNTYYAITPQKYLLCEYDFFMETLRRLPSFLLSQPAHGGFRNFILRHPLYGPTLNLRQGTSFRIWSPQVCFELARILGIDELHP